MDKKFTVFLAHVKLIEILNKSDWGEKKEKSMTKQKIFPGYNNYNKTVECTKCKTHWKMKRASSCTI